jgi:MFS family permease
MAYSRGGMDPAATTVWRNQQFLKLWLGGSISSIGSQVTVLALPLIAVLSFNAGPAETGILTAAALAPHLVIGLPAGVWVDRLPKLPVRIVSDLLNALVVGAVPLAAALGVLQLNLLYVVAFLGGMLSIFSRLTTSTMLPSLVGRRNLLEANGAILGSFAFAQIVGPSLAGVLMQVVSPPSVLLIDAGTFLASAVFSTLIVEPAREEARHPRSGLVAEIGEGLAFLRGNPILLRLTVCIGLANVAWFAAQAVTVPFATHDLGLSTAQLGFALGVVGPAGLAGAIVAARIARGVGLGPTLIASLVGELLSRFVLLAAAGPPLIAASIVGASQAIFGFIAPLWDVNSNALRQTLTPERLLGRVTAASGFVGMGSAPIGAILGGWIGEAFGARTALAFAAVMTIVAVAVLLVPSVVKLRVPTTHPATIE